MGTIIVIVALIVGVGIFFGRAGAAGVVKIGLATVGFIVACFWFVAVLFLIPGSIKEFDKGDYRNGLESLGMIMTGPALCWAVVRLVKLTGCGWFDD